MCGAPCIRGRASRTRVPGNASRPAVRSGWVWMPGSGSWFPAGSSRGLDADPCAFVAAVGTACRGRPHGRGTGSACQWATGRQWTTLGSAVPTHRGRAVGSHDGLGVRALGVPSRSTGRGADSLPSTLVADSEQLSCRRRSDLAALDHVQDRFRRSSLQGFDYG